MRCAPRMSRARRRGSSSIGEVAAGHPFDGDGRRGRSRAHLHRRRGAARRRHRRDPGEHHARGRHASSSTSRSGKAGTSARPASISRQARCCSRKGRRLTDRDLALAAAMNHPALPVYRRPKVAVLATGDELVMPGTDPGPGRSSTRTASPPMALARARRLRGHRPRHRARPARRDRRRGARAPATAAPTSWSPPAAPRSATTTWCSRRSPPKAWRCRSGRSRCGPAGR